MNGVKIELVKGVKVPEWLLNVEEVSAVKERRRGILFTSLLIPYASAKFFRDGSVRIVLRGATYSTRVFSREEVLEIMSWRLEPVEPPQVNRLRCSRCWTLTGVPISGSAGSESAGMECSQCKNRWGLPGNKV